jgi:FAD/FMN-containing dehydrogenase/Fe-S oxidoreductase
MTLSPHNSAAAAFRAHFGAGFRDDAATRILYATDASIYRCEPLGVLFPRDRDDLTTAVAIAEETRTPLLPRGAGTSLSGQAITSGIILDLAALNRITIAGDRAIIEPGAIVDRLNVAAAPAGLRFGPIPASSNRATIGGLIANNGTGAHALKYRMASDHLLAATVLLSHGAIRTFRENDLDQTDPLDGRIIEIAAPLRQSARWPRTWRSASGLDLRGVFTRRSLLPLLAGSEGSLGILLELELKLVPRPRRSMLSIFHYDSVVAAMRAVPGLLETRPSAVELMDRTILDLAASSPRFRLNLITGNPPAILVVEHEDQDVAEEMTRRGARLVISDPRGQAEIWATRKEGLGIIASRRGRARPIPFIEDCAVPVEMLPEYVERLGAILDAEKATGAWYAHAGTGCLHLRPRLDLHDPGERARMERITEAAVDLLVDLGGSLTGEHGDGRSKCPWHERFFGKEIARAFDSARDAFDPIGTFRPAGESRLRAEEPTPAFQAALAWPEGFAEEVERCNGEAACRKMEGLMCPSFQATGEEGLSTRGRANLVGAWLLGAPVEEAMLATLRQCLACKGCLGDCPSQVDMALIKAEMLHRLPKRWRDHFFARFELLSRIGRITGIPFAGLVKRITGIAPELELPVPTRRGVMSNTSARRESSGGAELKRSTLKSTSHSAPPDDSRRAEPDEPAATLFVDTLMEYYEPSIGIAALDLFKRMGLAVRPILGGSTGRPAFSRGLLDLARREIEQIAISGEDPVIVVEPSDWSMLAHDAARLVPGAEPLARRIVTIESFLLEHADRLPQPAKRARFLYHGHCHQKAYGIADEGWRLLERFGEVTSIECGCCGMAGAFGYEAENRALSVAIAEKGFFPALREVGDAIIAIAGRSCREQAASIGVKAIHPVEAILRALEEEKKKC